MLFTLVYRSHVAENFPHKDIESMVFKANKVNQSLDITGILLFNGTHFFQLLEGPEQAVIHLFEGICTDGRHHNVVELMRDYAPSRRFGNTGMELFDLRENFRGDVLQAVLERGTSLHQLNYHDRALHFLRTFVCSHERENYFELPPEGSWKFVSEGEVLRLPAESAEDHTFAFQPVADPLSQRVTDVEARLRTPAGDGAERYFSGMTAEAMCQADIASKETAFRLAKSLGLGSQSLCVNVSSLALVTQPGATDTLLSAAKRHGLIPEQIVVGITENEVVTDTAALSVAIRALRSAGMRLAINDFGSGAGGLQMLARLQPERIKIDAELVRDVHASGPKQAIIQGLLRSCQALEIAVTASGISKPEEWMWLEAAGVSSFQGDLFAPPELNGLNPVAWPEPV
ncbi:diguanylate phosphodiesterase [Erwinia persicina]|uniref:diguanylate phosphodiesterase n=1 Tax=Erwinia persicina TaxID=55211 RepID=UPI001785E124|nr:diguanylate phosphodiesterase [Erwinia persicina]MBD8165182.1 diguanylate phosphodiesterase [Erwinia persicina]